MPLEEAYLLIEDLDRLPESEIEELRARIGLFITDGDLSSTFQLEREELAVLWRALRNANLPPGGREELRRLLQQLHDDGAFD